MTHSLSSLLYKQVILHRQLLSYLFVGVFNTAVTAVVIHIMLSLNYHYVICNLAGYICGIVVSFILNSKITFKVAASLTTAFKFVCALLIAYLINIAIVSLAITIIPDYPYLAQLSGMPFYIVFGFLLNKHWVFKE